jgi:hypothetical protein
MADTAASSLREKRREATPLAFHFIIQSSAAWSVLGLVFLSALLWL